MCIEADLQNREDEDIKRQRIKSEIQALYEKVVVDEWQKDENWLLLIEKLEAYAAPTIWSVLKKSPYASQVAFEDAVSMAKSDFCDERVIGNYQNALERTPNILFCDYCLGIYRNKAWDYVKKNMKTPTVSLDHPDKSVMPYLPDSKIVFPELEPTVTERFIEYYTGAVMHSKFNPFHIIFLCYSKILPVILVETNCSSADKWAWEHMQGRNMYELSDIFVMLFNSTARIVRVQWGSTYRQKLEETYVNCRKENIRLGQAVLTEEYTQSNAKNWVARMNEKAIKLAVKAILKSGDTELIDMAVSYTGGKYSI